LRDDSGSLRTIVRADVTGHLIEDGDFHAFVTSLYGGAITVSDAALDGLREMTVRDRYPVIGQSKCDTSGNLFVEEYVRPGAESRYVVSFSPDGLLRGVSELPAAYRLLGVHNDALILLTTDDLGIESVEVRELLGG
jgi:hypothetical protein